MNHAESALFNPPNVDFRPVERQLATVRELTLAIWGLPTLIAGLVVSLIWRQWWVIAATAGLAVLLVWQAILIPRRVRAMAYAVRDRDLFWRSGLMFRQLTIVPYVRIQYVDLHVGPLERSFGLATLTINTAAPSLTVTLRGLTPEIAAQLRDILTDREKLTGVTSSESIAEQAASPVVFQSPSSGDTALIATTPIGAVPVATNHTPATWATPPPVATDTSRVPAPLPHLLSPDHQSSPAQREALATEPVSQPLPPADQPAPDGRAA